MYPYDATSTNDAVLLGHQIDLAGGCSASGTSSAALQQRCLRLCISCLNHHTICMQFHPFRHGAAWGVRPNRHPWVTLQLSGLIAAYSCVGANSSISPPRQPDDPVPISIEVGSFWCRDLAASPCDYLGFKGTCGPYFGIAACYDLTPRKRIT